MSIVSYDKLISLDKEFLDYFQAAIRSTIKHCQKKMGQVRSEIETLSKKKKKQPKKKTQGEEDEDEDNENLDRLQDELVQ